jgi:hypothetical protein
MRKEKETYHIPVAWPNRHGTSDVVVGHKISSKLELAAWSRQSVVSTQLSKKLPLLSTEQQPMYCKSEL